MAEKDNWVMILQYAPTDVLVQRVADMALAGHLPAISEVSVAGRLGYSTRQLRRIWWHAAGESIGSFLRRIAMERAAGFLSTTKRTVGEVATGAGYSTIQAFCRAFGEHFDCPPSEFRSLNCGVDRLMPGFLLSEGSSRSLPKHVHVVTGVGSETTFVYDGPILLAKVLPSGEIDWRP